MNLVTAKDISPALPPEVAKLFEARAGFTVRLSVLAKACGEPKRTISDWCFYNELPAIRVGRGEQWRVDRDAALKIFFDRFPHLKKYYAPTENI